MEGEVLGAGMAYGREMRSEELAPVEAQRLGTSSEESRDYLCTGGMEGGKEGKLVTELRLNHKHFLKPASL